MSGTVMGAACIVFPVILTKWYNMTFMIHSTDEEMKAEWFIRSWASKPPLLDTFCVIGPIPCSVETVLCAGETDILGSN